MRSPLSMVEVKVDISYTLYSVYTLYTQHNELEGKTLVTLQVHERPQ